MAENEAIKSNEELGCELACEVIAQVNEKSIEFEAKMMDVTLKRWGYCKADVEKALLELEQYRKLGTVEEVREAAEKTVVMNPEITTVSTGTIYMKCPKCKLTTVIYREMIVGYCPKCGQRLEK